MRATTRRGLAAMIASVAAAPSWAVVPPSRRIAFDVVRRGSRIGAHTIDFRDEAGALVVDIALDIVVRAGPIAVFRYRHRATERWRDGAFLSLVSRTDDDGTAAFANVERRADGLLAVEGSKSGRVTAPAAALPATHWNYRQLSAPMINPQHGEVLTPAVLDRGEETLADGAARRAPGGSRSPGRRRSISGTTRRGSGARSRSRRRTARPSPTSRSSAASARRQRLVERAVEVVQAGLVAAEHDVALRAA
ncbi:MAG: hypothetical protein IPK81_22700 [Rhodospirillales bacterium]|nr:MAG: hypothetical protein IPK81_22700 [Rhodospirillales bacterium]